MRQVVRGRTTIELEKNIKQREHSGWRRITENKLDDSCAAYGDVSWVCVMELDNDQPDKKRSWGFMNS